MDLKVIKSEQDKHHMMPLTLNSELLDTNGQLPEVER